MTAERWNAETPRPEDLREGLTSPTAKNRRRTGTAAVVSEMAEPLHLRLVE